MPQNGDVNRKFGVYRSVCCGAEIVISEGVTFPDCPKHMNLPTRWKPVGDDRIRHVSEVMEKDDDSAA